MKILIRLVICLPIFLLLSACSLGVQQTTEHAKENPQAEIMTETPVSKSTETPVSNSEEIPTSNGSETPISNGTETSTSDPIDNIEGGMDNVDITNLPQVEFGYANADGSKIIVLYDYEFKDNSRFTYFKYAIGENGKVYEIEYDAYQESGAEDNGRQTANNFANQQGCVYRVKKTNAIQNQTYMLITQNANDEGALLLENKDVILTTYLAELIERCSTLANRKVKNGWLLSEYREGYQVSMIEFENKDTDLLAWLVLESDEVFLYCELPAKLSDDGYSGWRYGDCGDMAGGFDIIDTIDIICTIQKQQEIIVYLSWYGEEG